jgi:uncharacterized protein YndB with AHSA1/START domain
MEPRPDQTEEAVKNATGRGWDEWVEALSAAGAREWPHKDIVSWLERETKISSWWRQAVTVGFEKLTGKRVLGETADAGFQVGIRRTYPMAREELWRRLMEPAAVAIWLGVEKADIIPGAQYDGGGVSGEFRTVKPGDRIRFTRVLAGGRPTTVQLGLSAPVGEKTAVTFHHEKLADTAEREAMRAHWKGVADRLSALWAGDQARA